MQKIHQIEISKKPAYCAGSWRPSFLLRFFVCLSDPVGNAKGEPKPALCPESKSQKEARDRGNREKVREKEERKWREKRKQSGSGHRASGK